MPEDLDLRTKIEGIKGMSTCMTASYAVDNIPKAVQDNVVVTSNLNNGDVDYPVDQNEGGAVDNPVDRDVGELAQCEVEEARTGTDRLELRSVGQDKIAEGDMEQEL